MARQCPPGTSAYTVRAGDTFYDLARRYGTTVAAIIAANPGVNPNQLFVGQTLCMPGKPPTTCPAGSFSYTIVAGDTLYAIAQRNNTTVNAIIALNPGINPNALRIGQVICVPGRPVPPPTTCPAGSFSYTIVAGDTLYAIAQRNNTTVDAIIALNPGINPNALRIGQVICVPGRPIPPPTTCPAGSFSYTIVAGDTLYAIAQRNNTTVDAIIALNPGIDPNSLRVGQIICVPGRLVPPPSTCPAGTTAYTVKAGDTLYAIAFRFNITVDAILAANPGLDPNRLQVGQTICIPGSTAPSTCPANSTPYTVQATDSFYRIAQTNNVSLDALLAANPGIDPDRLSAGQVICIPGTA